MDIKNIKHNIEEYFSSFNIRLQNFIASNKKIVLIVTGAVVVSLILLIVIIIATSTGKSRSDEVEPHNVVRTTKIDPNVFWLLDEPLDLPGIQLSHEQNKKWDEDDIEFWYEKPSDETMEKLHKHNKKIIEKLLEETP